jgi:arylsulfatase A-like enzyme
VKDMTRHLDMLRYGLLVLLLIDSAVAYATLAKNVLFIAIDDLRPALGCYGDPTAISPNIDRLAQRGMAFNRAYCQQAVCSPSRLSLLSGRRPDTIRVWDLNTHFREAVPELITLPQHFKQQGYSTRSIGKIFHGSGKPSKDPPSWSEAPLYDYVQWQDWKSREVLARELYDHTTDPHEMHNQAANPEYFQSLETLSEMLKVSLKGKEVPK